MLAATGASTKGLGPPVLDMAAGNPAASCSTVLPGRHLRALFSVWEAAG